MSGETLDSTWMSEIREFPLQDCWNAWQTLVDMIIDIWLDQAKFLKQQAVVADQMQRVASIATRTNQPSVLDGLNWPIGAVRSHVRDISALHIVMWQFTPMVRNLITQR